jgi:hypothetical protein
MDCKVPCIERDLLDIAARGHFEAVLRFDSIVEEFNGHGHVIEPDRKLAEVFTPVLVFILCHNDLLIELTL